MSPRSEQDFERLSAYIDNELAPAEKAEMEARLAQEPELKAGLDDLRRTVSALKALPAVKPPRNFTLTPAQAGVRAQRGPLFPVFRLAAALCSLLLMLAVARDLTTSGALASPTETFSVQNSAAATAPGVLVPNAAPLMTSTAEGGATTLGGGVPVPTGTTQDNVVLTPMARLNAAPASPSPESMVHSLAPSGPLTATTTADQSLTLAPTELPSEAPPQETAVSVAALPATPEQTPVTAFAAPQPATSAPGLSTLRLAEIVLAVLAVGLAAAAWFTRHG